MTGKEYMSFMFLRRQKCLHFNKKTKEMKGERQQLNQQRFGDWVSFRVSEALIFTSSRTIFSSKFRLRPNQVEMGIL